MNTHETSAKILIDDGMQIKLGTGIGKYSEHLGRALGTIPGVTVDYLGFDEAGKNRTQARLSYLKYINTPSFRKYAEKFDLCIFTNYASPFKKLKTRTAVTIHDLAVFDHPETLPRAYLPYGRVMINNSMRRADCIVTVSKTMAADIKARYPHDAGKVTYSWPGVYNHVRTGEAGNPYNDETLARVARSSFFLMVGTVEKRKNIGFVIEAFSEYKKKSLKDDFKLILAGRAGFGFDDIEQVAIESGCRDDVVFTGYVSDNDCANLYRDAQALIFPSVYEGFGSIQIECMAMGLPIILSDIPTNREVSQEYGLYFSLGDTEGLIKAFQKAKDIDKSYSKSICAHYLTKFDWNKTALEYLYASGLRQAEA